MKKIMHIPVNNIKGLFIGTEHAGKWFGGMVLKIAWIKEDEELVSGFTVAGSKEETDANAEVFETQTLTNSLPAS